MTPNRGQNLRTERQGDVWRATLPATISAELEDPLLSEARAAIADGCKEVILDFSRAEYADSASIGVIILLYRLVQQSQVALAFAGVHGQPLVLVERTGLDQRVRMITPKGDSPSAPSQTGP